MARWWTQRQPTVQDQPGAGGSQEPASAVQQHQTPRALAPVRTSDREPMILLASCLALLGVSGIRPFERKTWLLEVSPVVLGVPILHGHIGLPEHQRLL